ncbi:hypothetical protein CISIN_1g039018mg, partial [Citrus sinensis]
PIPNGPENLSSLRYLDLSDNQFNSTIPEWISRINCTISSGLGNLTSLKHSISYNVLEGKLPTSFGRLREPRSISLSWANKSQEILEIFHSFSRDNWTLRSLQILDIACNNLSGAIPACISNSSARKEVGYTSILNLLRITDRSKNNFSGVLPAELVTDLVALRSLNLFHNHFKEKFPGSIH